MKKSPISPQQLTWVFLSLSVLLYVSWTAYGSFQKLDKFQYIGYDLSIFTQATWLISQGQTPFVSVRGVHILGDHFSPLLYLLAPIFRLFPTPKTLLLSQSLALGSGAFPLFLLAHHRLKSNSFALLFAILYLCHPGVSSINLAEFHPDTFAVPALLLAIWGFETERRKVFFASIVIAMMTKETVGFYVFIWGLTLLQRDRKAAIATMGAGLAGWLIANLAIRACNHWQPTPYLWIYHNLGNSLPEILHTLFAKPNAVIAILNRADNRNVLYLLFVPLALLPLLQPIRLLPAVPVLLSVFLSSRDWMHRIDQWSLCPALPFLFDASIAGFDWLVKDYRSFRKLQILLSGCLLAAIAGNIAIIHSLQIQQRFFKTQAQVDSIHSVLQSIPPESSVSASTVFLPHLAMRQTVYCFALPFYRAGWGGGLLTLRQHDGYDLNELSETEAAKSIENSQIEYLLISYGHTSIVPKRTYLRLLRLFLASKKYELVEIKRERMLLKKSDNPETSLPKFEKFMGMKLQTAHKIEEALDRWMSTQG